ncbi:hypothetical protein ACQY0O_006355 [Thecaphora frezii]
MPSAVLYYCPCDSLDPAHANPAAAAPAAPGGSLSSGSTSASSTSASASASHSFQLALSNSPSVPTPSSAASYAFHPLESLYFCDECDQIRCNRCVSVDIAAYFCPNCLFEVPSTGIKQARSKCPRNCFLCPSCDHTLSVVATDTPEDVSLTSPDAVLGQPPFFLQCSFCRWDSKVVGMTFEKQTGLGRQLDKFEQSAPDLLEMYHLRDHFDPFITAQTEAAQAAAAASTQDRRSANKSSSSSSGSRSMATGSQASIAASAALQKSKLLRDIPQLTSSHYLTGVAEKPKLQRREEKEELRPYEPFTSWTSGRTKGQQKGVLGRREDSRREYLAGFTGSDERISTLSQRWSSPWDQPVRTSDLHPTRVPLRCKQAKRCPACRHIIIKPDLKAESRRFKIKLLACSYMPEIELELAPVQPHLQVAGAGSVGSASGSRLHRRTSVLGLASGSSSLRRRPLSMLSGGSAFGGSGMASDLVDEESLLPGKTYVFEATFTNPLDDAMRVKIGVARPAVVATAGAATGVASTHGSTAPSIFPELEPTAEERERALEREQGRGSWSVVVSTTSFGIHAYNEVWELEEDQDLLGEKRDEDDEDDVDELDGLDRGGGDDGFSDSAHASSSGGVGEGGSSGGGGGGSGGGTMPRRRKKNSGILRRKGHTTTIGFDLHLSKDIAEGTVLETTMLVNYTPYPEGTEASKAQDGRPFSFWTALRFGKVGKAIDVQAKRATLEKRRSVLGLSNAGQAERPATPSSLSQAMRGLHVVREDAHAVKTDEAKTRDS